MTIRIKKQTDISGLLSRVQAMSGVNLNVCFQCKKCSIGCPVSNIASSSAAEIIRRLQLGAGDDLLKSDLIWLCLSCETCAARCPNGINFAAVVDALRALSAEKGIVKPKGDMPLFNKLFLDTVKSYGRTYDLQMIGLYKLKTGNIKQDMDKFPTMLKKGKMAILPPSGANKGKIKRIFKKTAENKGTEK
jgi:heterodisulfide reductase subunit C